MSVRDVAVSWSVSFESCELDRSSCFFVKQKTAFDMRISDWSSDVCSSDLGVVLDAGLAAEGRVNVHPLRNTGTLGLSGAAILDLLRHWGHDRSEERRVGKEGVSTRRSRWSPFHTKKKKVITTTHTSHITSF